MKLLLPILLAMLLSNALLAKDTKPKKPYYKVEVVDEGKKGAWGKVIYKIGDFCFSVVVGAISNSKSVNSVITKVELYFNNKSSEHRTLIEAFGGKIHAEIIEHFEPDAFSYERFSPMKFSYALKQDAYVYLVNISQAESCLLYPNKLDNISDKINAGKYQLPSNSDYTFISDSKNSDEEFYLISSVRPIYFDEFKKKSIYHCTSRNKGIQKIAKIQNNQYANTRRVKISIK